FCEIHYAETTIVPIGIKNGYPTEINFTLLETRVTQMKEELLKIINKEIDSYYYNLAIEVCEEVGARKASTPMVLMGRFESLRPGYYGSIGLNIICDTLIKLFIYPNILTFNITYPKKPMDYLQEVLVPEAALRLISQDREEISLENA
ncbi:hypothetical protein C2G38_1948909, partial [Gigaspora rosea]